MLGVGRNIIITINNQLRAGVKRIHGSWPLGARTISITGIKSIFMRRRITSSSTTITSTTTTMLITSKPNNSLILQNQARLQWRELHQVTQFEPNRRQQVPAVAPSYWRMI